MSLTPRTNVPTTSGSKRLQGGRHKTGPYRRLQGLRDQSREAHRLSLGGRSSLDRIQQR